jgi:translation initiation factor 3 subunit I
MYETFGCSRLGLFDVKESCKSIDVSKDSRFLLAAATTVGYCIFNVNDGKELARGKVPGFQTKQVEFALGDKQFLVMYDEKKRSFIRIFDFERAL